MSIKLPQEVQTNKLKTLPDDLRAIADEMLKEKFGIKEVVTESGSPFPDDRGRASQPNDWCGNSLCSSCVGGPERGCRDRFDPRFNNTPSHGIRTPLISLEGCCDILRQLERDVGPRIKRGKTEWRMGRREFDDLTRDRRFDSAGRIGRNGPELFGFPVLLQGIETHEITLLNYW